MGRYWVGIFFDWVSVPMVTIMVSISYSVWCLILTLFLLSFCLFAFSRLWPHLPTISLILPLHQQTTHRLQTYADISPMYLVDLLQRPSYLKWPTISSPPPLLYLPIQPAMSPPPTYLHSCMPTFLLTYMSY